MNPKYAEGQRVKIVTLIEDDGKPDLRIQSYVNKTGIVIKSYCVTKDEMPELSKMFVYPDVYCCDVRLEEDGDILRGVPEAALESCPY